MAPILTSDSLRTAAGEARRKVVAEVELHHGLKLDDLYAQLVTEDDLPEPAVRTAIWDLIAERAIVIQPGNTLRPGGDPA